MFSKSLAMAAVATVAFAGVAEARDQIQIVGSSTVFPFATKVAEEFGRTTQFPTPVIESTGSGGGLKLFCAGVGPGHPDITNASRAIKKSEIELCKTNGVNSITEVLVGYDGIVLSNSKDAPQMNITKAQTFLALAKTVPDPNNPSNLVDNPYTRWSQIDSGLPDYEISVYGPPPTSGTRDAFVELVMEEGCTEFDAIAALESTDEDRFDAVCGAMREDGRFVEAGENDTLIINRLVENRNAFGIFGFSFLDQNSDRVQGAQFNGVAPTFENIATGDYKVSRPLFFYVKNQHVGVIPGIEEYVAEFTSEKAFGPDGYLPEIGLIPLDSSKRQQVRQDATKLEGNLM